MKVNQIAFERMLEIRQGAIVQSPEEQSEAGRRIGTVLTLPTLSTPSLQHCRARFGKTLSTMDSSLGRKRVNVSNIMSLCWGKEQNNYKRCRLHIMTIGSPSLCVLTLNMNELVTEMKT